VCVGAGVNVCLGECVFERKQSVFPKARHCLACVRVCMCGVYIPVYASGDYIQESLK